MNETMLSIEDVARLLSISRRSVDRWKLMDKIGCVRFGRKRRVTQAAFDAWVKANTEPPRKAA